MITDEQGILFKQLITELEANTMANPSATPAQDPEIQAIVKRLTEKAHQILIDAGNLQDRLHYVTSQSPQQPDKEGTPVSSASTPLGQDLITIEESLDGIERRIRDMRSEIGI